MTGKITAVLLALLLITGIATKNIGFLEAKKDTGNGSVYYLNFKPEQDGEWQKFPDSVIEATMIDGCNPLQTFFKVVLPVIIIYLIGQRHIVKGILAGSVMG